MKVGDYVRTDKGEIGKVTSIANDNDFELSEEYNDFVAFNTEPYVYGDIIKSSPNIIDLIEVGDYVNGWRVNRVEKEEDGTLLTVGTITSFISRTETEPYLTQDYNEADKMCKTKSIVTKEQFESIEYKVVD